MKKHLLSYFILFGSVAALAQPSITNVVVPTVGQKITFSKAQYMSPGTGGANQTWNFGTLAPTGVRNFTMGLPSATPYQTNFPNATLQMNDGTDFEFFSTTGNDLSSEGVVNSIGTQPNTNAEKFMQFPINFNNTYTDAWGGPMVVSTVSATRTASTTVTYDGYGTLTTPAGTFTNVARLHVVQSISDAAGFITVTRGNDEYRYYSPVFTAPLLTIYTRTASVSTTSTGSEYQMVNPTNPVGLSEQSQGNSAIVAYPNPAADVLNLQAIQDRAVSVELFNFQGKLIYSEMVAEGNSPVQINVSAYSEGLYFVRVNTVNGRVENKKVFIRR